MSTLAVETRSETRQTAGISSVGDVAWWTDAVLRLRREEVWAGQNTSGQYELIPCDFDLGPKRRIRRFDQLIRRDLSGPPQALNHIYFSPV